MLVVTKLILESSFDLSRILAPPKISRYTVIGMDLAKSETIMERLSIADTLETAGGVLIREAFLHISGTNLHLSVTMASVLI